MRFVHEAQIVTNDENLEYVDSTKQDKKVFQEVYPFATEAVSGYFSRLDLKDKSLLTVGSSCDQAFNALVLGAKNITVYDINANVETYYKLKKNLVLNYPRKELYNEVTKITEVPFSTDLHGPQAVTEMNNYLQSDENYEILRQRLQENNVEFIQGDIFDFNKSLGDKKYDRIVLSNILQYLDFFSAPNDPYKFLAEKFPDWKEHLNDEGILQLLYLYSYEERDLRKNNHSVPSYNLASIVNALKGNPLEIEWIPTFSNNSLDDAIVTYTKKR